MRKNLGLQNEITVSGTLLSSKGTLNQRGWARKPILTYNKENIAKSWIRIKEWDHFSILNPEFGIQLTIGDIGYLTQMSFVFLDFKKRKRFDYATMKFLTRSKLLPQSSLEDSIIEFPTNKFNATIEKRGNLRLLKLDNIQIGKKIVQGDVKLTDDPSMDNTVVVTGYKEDSKLFYYNHKVNYMPAKGGINFGGKEYTFDPQTSFGLMDWGRGIWPYRTHWLWGSACGIIDGIPIAFNIGYGFGDLSSHTENIFFYNGKVHKLDEVVFHHENRDPSKPWKFTSNDNRFRMELVPLIPHREKLNYGLISLNSCLLHGLYSGEVLLDEGDIIRIENMLGHAEDIYWRW